MAQIRFKGFQAGENIGTVSATVGADTGNVAVASFQLPSAQTTLPTISDAFDDGTLTPDDNGITVTTRLWRNADTLASLGSGATLSGSGLGGVQVEYSPDNGTTWSPAVEVYESGMMASHDADDAAVMTIVPHGDMTHIAVTDGNWTSPATWSTGAVPKYGAVVLIPYGVTVKYDVTEANIRLDRIRVDGRLWVDTVNATTEQFKMLVETVVVTRGGDFEIGTAANRLPATASFTCTISGKDYSATSYLPTDMKSSRFLNARGWERGVIFMGRGSIWGARKTTWFKANPIDVSATSLTYRGDVTGLSVDDTIVIGGTDCDYNDPVPIWQDEERVISSISGNTISWVIPLVHPHKNQHSGSTRTDLYPAVVVKGNKNITFSSEITGDNARRGHLAWMHHHCTVDAWDMQSIDMGRTSKIQLAGVIDENDLFSDAVTQGQTLTNRVNITGRYPIHLHHVGFNHTGARPIVNNCYVAETPGWGIVHHSCDADFQECAIYRFAGAGLVSESANETGGWIDCCAMQSTVESSRLAFSAKIAEEYAGLGDTFRLGYGFGYRGRAMRAARCVAVSCYSAHGFWHREGGAYIVSPVTKPKRSNVDLKKAGALALRSDYAADEWDHNEYPIIHFADCEAIGTFWGFNVTKLSPKQFHDVNIRLKRFKAWGYRRAGGDIEYVGAYLLDQWDCVSGETNRSSTYGVLLGQNAHQILMRSPRIEGGQHGAFVNGGSNTSTFGHDADDPRWGWHGQDILRVGSDKNAFVSSPYTDEFYEEADPENSLIDYDADPTESYPLVLGAVDGTGAWASGSPLGNASGQKQDNISANAPILTKAWDQPFRNGTFDLKRIGRIDGFYQYDGMDVYVMKDIISDRITARPFKMTKLFESPPGTFWNEAESIDNGALNYGANPTTANDLTALVAKNGSVTINIPTASGAAGGDGTTYTLDTGDYIAPDHGRVTLDGGTGDLTFTPDSNYIGADEMFVFVESGHRFATVRINFLVTEDGTDAGLTTPVVDTHFAASDGGSQTIDVELFDPPSAGERRIEVVQYSTDGGTTWRRLCNFWVKAIHTITVESDGTAIAAGSYNIRIRYKVDYDFVNSTASGDDAVTVV